MGRPVTRCLVLLDGVRSFRMFVAVVSLLSSLRRWSSDPSISYWAPMMAGFLNGAAIVMIFVGGHPHNGSYYLFMGHLDVVNQLHYR
jgi:hypothetical protein